jgi:Ca2+:H+ antiporter
VAIQKGLIALVLASITGSILGNLLLILGFSVFLGGLKFGIQSFDRRQAAVNSTMLILSIIALFGASLIAALIALDGESNWLEGVQLLGVYAIIGLAFFFLP